MKKIIILFAIMLSSAAVFAQNKNDSVRTSAAPSLYNPQANARAAIDAAVAKAKKEGKHVFIQVGGNWCGWCIEFHKLVEATPDLKTYLTTNYEPVLVNYSQENKNAAVLASLGYPGRFGFPVFVILDGNGKTIHIQNSAYLE